MPAFRAGYHKQTKFKKTMFTVTLLRGPPGFINVRQLGKLCANEWRNPAACVHSNNCICVNLITFMLVLAKKCIKTKNLQCENGKIRKLLYGLRKSQ